MKSNFIFLAFRALSGDSNNRSSRLMEGVVVDTSLLLVVATKCTMDTNPSQWVLTSLRQTLTEVHKCQSSLSLAPEAILLQPKVQFSTD